MGKPFSEEGIIKKCITAGQPAAGVIPRNVYGKRLKVSAWPILDDGGALQGSYGVVTYLFHPIGKALPLFAKPLAEAFNEGAFVMGTDREKCVIRQGSSKFDIQAYQSGTVLNPGYPADGVCAHGEGGDQGAGCQLFRD